MENFPRLLPRALKPSLWQGCAESLGDPYLRQVPLPRIPDSRDLRSRRNPKDTFPTKLSIKSQRQADRAPAARLNTSTLRHATRINVLHAIRAPFFIEKDAKTYFVSSREFLRFFVSKRIQKLMMGSK